MSRRSKALIVGLLTGLVGLGLTPVFQNLEEDTGLDLLFRLRGTRKSPPEVVVVTLDKDSADFLRLPPEPEKWPRILHARLTEHLAKQGVRAIAFDIIFDEPRSTEHDHFFAEAIKKAGNVVLCESLKKEAVALTDQNGRMKGPLSVETAVPPIPILARSAVALAPFPLPKVPVKVSQYWTFKAGAGDTPTLPLVVFQLFTLDLYDEILRLMRTVNPNLSVPFIEDKDLLTANNGLTNFIRDVRELFLKEPRIPEQMLRELKNEERSISDSRRNQLLSSLIKTYRGEGSRYLNFYGPPGSIRTVPFYHLLQSPDVVSAEKEEIVLHGKAVFVGLSERLRPEQKDGFYTVFSQPTGSDISGVEIAATAFANLLEDLPVRPLGPGISLATICLWGVAIGILCFALPAAVAAGAILIASALYLFAAKYQFQQSAIWFPLVVPLFFQVPIAFFACLAWKYLETGKERENIRKAFGYYLPDKVVDQVAKNIDHLQTGGQLMYGTCLFTDAERYTTLSEKLEPDELHRFMNQYFEALFEPVTRHGGIVAEVQGDGMLAIWATSQPDVVLRNQACLAALDIANAAHHFNECSPTLQLPTRIGLHSGYMHLGNVGAIDHYEYRPTGDIVNTASRIEGLNKYLGTERLVSKEVLDQLDGFLARELGEFLLVGKSKPVFVYELMCRKEDATTRQRYLCDAFAKALSAYRKRAWDEATEILHKCSGMVENDGPSAFYLNLCEKYREDHTGENWTEVICLSAK